MIKITKYMFKSSYDLANEILGEDLLKEEEKKLTTEIVEAKISILEKNLNFFNFFLDAKNCK